MPRNDGTFAAADYVSVYVVSTTRALRGMPVIWMGKLTGADLAAAYAALDVFVHTGTEETFGQTVQEAHASGLPAVAPPVTPGATKPPPAAVTRMQHRTFHRGQHHPRVVGHLIAHGAGGKPEAFDRLRQRP